MSQELTRCHDELRKTIKDSAEVKCVQKNNDDDTQVKLAEQGQIIGSYKRQLAVGEEEMRKVKQEVLRLEQELSEVCSKAKVVDAHIGTLSRLLDCPWDTSAAPTEEALVTIISCVNRLTGSYNSTVVGRMKSQVDSLGDSRATDYINVGEQNYEPTHIVNHHERTLYPEVQSDSQGEPPYKETELHHVNSYELSPRSMFNEFNSIGTTAAQTIQHKFPYKEALNHDLPMTLSSELTRNHTPSDSFAQE